MKYWDDKNENLIIDADTIRRFNKENPLSGRYACDERVLGDVANSLINKNSKFEDVYHMVTLINSFYSTRMGGDDCYALSKILYNRHGDILGAMDSGDKNVVQSVIKDQVDAREKHDEHGAPVLRSVAFSFTSKYFSIISRYRFHNDKFPIYDSLVAGLLDFWYRNKGTNVVSKTRKNYNYMEYCKYINRFCGVVEYKELDSYLWTLGRKIVPYVTDISAEEYKRLMPGKDLKTGKDKYTIAITSSLPPDTMERILKVVARDNQKSR